jgi:hypothetical protein
MPATLATIGVYLLGGDGCPRMFLDLARTLRGLERHAPYAHRLTGVPSHWRACTGRATSSRPRDRRARWYRPHRQAALRRTSTPYCTGSSLRGVKERGCGQAGRPPCRANRVRYRPPCRPNSLAAKKLRRHRSRGVTARQWQRMVRAMDKRAAPPGRRRSALLAAPPGSAAFAARAGLPRCNLSAMPIRLPTQPRGTAQKISCSTV